MSLWIKLGWIRNRIPWSYHPSFAWLSVRVSQNSQNSKIWQHYSLLQFDQFAGGMLSHFAGFRYFLWREVSVELPQCVTDRTCQDEVGGCEGKHWGLNPGWTEKSPGMFHDVSWDMGCFHRFLWIWGSWSSGDLRRGLLKSPGWSSMLHSGDPTWRTKSFSSKKKRFPSQPD